MPGELTPGILYIMKKSIAVALVAACIAACLATFITFKSHDEADSGHFRQSARETRVHTGSAENGTRGSHPDSRKTSHPPPREIPSEPGDIHNHESLFKQSEPKTASTANDPKKPPHGAEATFAAPLHDPALQLPLPDRFRSRFTDPSIADTTEPIWPASLIELDGNSPEGFSDGIDELAEQFVEKMNNSLLAPDSPEYRRLYLVETLRNDQLFRAKYGGFAWKAHHIQAYHFLKNPGSPHTGIQK